MLQDIFKIGLKTARSPENCHNAYDPEICILQIYSRVAIHSRFLFQDHIISIRSYLK